MDASQPVITPDAGPKPPAPTQSEPQATEAPAMTTDEAIRAAMEPPKPEPKAEKPEPKAEKSPPEPKPEAKEAQPKAEADPAPKAEPTPAPEPKAEAAPVEPAPKPAVEPPSRLSPEAKARWADTPAEVQHEIARAVQEMTAGIDGYRQQVEPLKPYLDLAKQAGVDLPQALKNYTEAERALHDNPLHALAQMAEQYMPGGLKAFVAQLTGQADPKETQLAELQRQNALLQQQMERQRQQSAELTAEQQRAAAQQLVASVADQMPRLDELRPVMRRLIEGGVIEDAADDRDMLLRAYEMAERLKPAPSEAAPPAEPAHTRAEATSLSGAPETAKPVKPAAPMTTDEAIQLAMRGKRVA